MPETIHTVSEVTAHIRDLFEADALLSDVWVAGEVSNMTQASSGHWYFTIKDSGAQMRCVMWRSAVARQKVTPQEGDAVEVRGQVTVYETRGEYQMYAEVIRPVGAGDLYQQFERLKARLEAEGLFEGEHKREPPGFPQKIGVVTSPTAAAFQDILNVLRRRYPLAEVILSPTMVQGEDAPPQIVAALRRMNEHTDVDIILLCRGGGSIEDLWAFNDERVARAVFSSRIPIIAGVGHETDFTIVDFVADMRAPTPSAAAELATPSADDLRLALGRASEKLAGLAYDAVITRGDNLSRLARSLERASPAADIRTYRQRVDDLNARAASAWRASGRLLRERLNGKTAALYAASPQAILSRGYALVTRSDDGRRVVSGLDVHPGEGISIRLRDGELKARVEDEETHGRYKRTLF